MAGFKSGELSFDSPRNIFYAGQTITGTVEFITDQPLTLTALTVHFLGEASVGWTEEETETYNGERRYKEVEYVGFEEYFNVTQLLAGGNAHQNLSPGTHSYQFSFMIPPSVPSSFDKDERGRVKYGAKATIELQGQTFIKEEYPRFFDVVAPFDLNLGNMKLREPIELEFEEAYSGCFCGSGPVSVRLHLPVSGYCPGQVIPVTVQADNGSNIEINNIILGIITRRRYRSVRPISEYVPPEEVLVSVKKGSIMSNSKRTYTVPLRVPDIIAPNLEACSIIDVGYFFRVIIKMTGCNDDMEDEAEICLGLLPLTATLDGPYTHPLANNLPVGPVPDIKAIQAALEAQERAKQNVPSQQSMMPQSTHNSQYSIQVREQYISSDPTKNYQIGFKIEQPGPPPAWLSNQMQDLKINLPPIPMNNFAPSAPPPPS